jgi:hypothetical protein
MEHYAGIDVSLELSSVCVVDAQGKIVKEAKVASELRMLLTHRQLLQSKAIAIENDLRATLRNFGLKVGMVGKVKFEARIRSLLTTSPT